MHAELLKIKNSYYLIFICLLTVFFTYFIRSTYLTEAVFYNSYADSMSYERIGEVFQRLKKLEIVGYLFIPILLTVKILYNSFWITTATLLDENRKYTYVTNYSICLKTEYVFIVLLMTKVFLFIFLKHVSTIDDISFIPGSLLSFFNPKLLPKWAIYPLLTVNIWEVFYCFAGVSFFAIKYNTTKQEAFYFFCVPYLVGLIVLILAVTFFTMQIT